MADVGQALTGKYWGHIDPDENAEDWKQWGEDWSEVVPLEGGVTPEDFMRTRPAGEEGATIKGLGNRDYMFIRRKPSEAPLTS